MRRILAIVCIFILLLFTGMPLFTSNLLCNETKVYADSVPEQLYTDREKVIAALTVYFNDHKGVLKVLNNGNNVDAQKYATVLYDMYIGTFITYYRYEQQTIQTLADIASYIDVTNDPFIVRLYSPAVGFFNAFLQWMLDNGDISNNQNGSDGLYNGAMIGDSLFYIYNSADSLIYQKDTYILKVNSLIAKGTPVDGYTSEYLKERFMNAYPSFDLTNNKSGNNKGTLNLSVTYASDQIHSFGLYGYGNSSIGSSNITNYNGGVNSTPCIAVASGWIVLYSDRSNKIRGNTAWMIDRNIPNSYAYGLISYDYTNNIYYIYKIGTTSRNDVSDANINLDKDGFDSDPTTLPDSDGLQYTPKQNGTGNTYNNYNYYYNDYYAGDTYISHPGDSGGGGNDPGGGGEEPSPGGTTPPWDGTQNPGTPAGTVTPGSDGYYFNLPDIGLPDLNIDWSINGLKEKFPFSIPWDLMAFFAVMNAQPETPEIQATIPLGLWEWDIDWDLHAFDNVARILRNMELIGFCIGLILITRSIIKG